MIIKESPERYLLAGSNIDLLEDVEGNLSIQEVASSVYAKKFRAPEIEIPSNKNREAAYWIRFTIKNETAGKKRWVLEFLDFRIDQLEFYEPDGEGGFKVKKGGDAYPFSFKEYKHKNFIFDLDLPAKEKTYYARIKSAEKVALFAEIESHNLLTYYSADEYYFLALFYGVIIALGLFNIFLFATSGDRSYLYYVFYILSVGIYAMTQDGTGFQYLWPKHPEFNNYAFAAALFSMVFWVLLYARTFLFVKMFLPLLNKVIIGTLALRIIVFVLGMTTIPSLLFIPLLDVLLMFLAYAAGVFAWRKGYKPALYYLAGFTFLFIGFSIAMLNAVGVLPNSVITVYSYNVGVLGQMFFFAFALAARIREISRQKEMIEEKNKELDVFVYKASHDIKGPLKSIMGLAKVAMKDIKSPEALNYFDIILKNTNRLDAILADLIMVTRVKQSESNVSKIDFNGMVKEILSSFEYLPSYKEMDFNLSVEQKKDFYADPALLYSVFQNLIENAIKYKKPSTPLFHPKEKAFLDIKVEVRDKETTIVFKDNGMGIKKELQPHIFDMFFRVDNNNVAGSGLGLYLVKISVEKLGGTIEVISEEDKGTVFTLKFEE